MSAPAASRLLLALTTALASSACVEPDDGRDQVSKSVSYQPGRNAIKAGEPMPALPCLPPSDGRIEPLTFDCAAEDFRVVSGPVESTDEYGNSLCSYVVAYTTPRNVHCIVGRPLADETGATRIAALLVDPVWSNPPAS